MNRAAAEESVEISMNEPDGHGLRGREGPDLNALVIGHDTAIGEEGSHSGLGGRNPRSPVLEDDSLLRGGPRSAIAISLMSARRPESGGGTISGCATTSFHVTAAGRSMPTGETNTTSRSATGSDGQLADRRANGVISLKPISATPLWTLRSDVVGVIGPAHPDDKTGIALTELAQRLGEEQPVRGRGGDHELSLVPHRPRRLSHGVKGGEGISCRMHDRLGLPR